MSIFDSIMGSIDSLDDSLSSLDLSDVASAAGKTLTSGSSTAKNSSVNTYDMLERMDRLSKNNISNLGQSYSVQNMKATRSDPLASVDPETINQQWLQRLNRYSSIPQAQGAKGK